MKLFDRDEVVSLIESMLPSLLAVQWVKTVDGMVPLNLNKQFNGKRLFASKVKFISARGIKPKSFYLIKYYNPPINDIIEKYSIGYKIEPATPKNRKEVVLWD